MGGSNSQPDYTETQAHLSHTSPVNDAYFNELHLVEAKEKEELLNALRCKCETIYPDVEEYLTSLRGQIGRADERLKGIGEEEGRKKLVFEVRKGVDIVPFGVETQKGVYVKGVIKPGNREIKTPLGRAYIPQWYHVSFVAYEDPQDVQSMTLTLYSVSLRHQEAAIASCEIDLREAIDTTQTRWHEFKWLWPHGDNRVIPQVEIRYWNLKSEQAFWENYKAVAMSELEEIEAAYERSRSGAEVEYGSS